MSVRISLVATCDVCGKRILYEADVDDVAHCGESYWSPEEGASPLVAADIGHSFPLPEGMRYRLLRDSRGTRDVSQVVCYPGCARGEGR